MKLLSATICFLLAFSAVLSKDCYNKKSNSKLFCYYGKTKDIDSCKCSHIILPASSDVKSIDGLRDKLGATKILLTVNEFNEDLVNTLKNAKVDGLEINLKKLDSKNDISDFISTVRSKLGSDLYLALTIPAKTETLAKYYDFKALSKNADVFILQTHFLGASKNVTFHPSRLSGMWDVQNTDSVVDLVSGMGAPLSKLVITAPVQAFKFNLQNEKHTAPGSPALELSTLTRDQLCERMSSDKWTLERDQDQAGPYIFRDKEWVSFEDSTSMDIKAKYSRVRGLAGLALKDVSQDGGLKCGESLLDAAFNGLSKQARAPRGAVLHSLEREILDTPARKLDNVQVSPYRISRVIDVEGKVHVIRQDTRTEFQCSRQGYFVHPRSCGRFYRCVKFDQLSDEFSVFEFDCPAGLAFDERVEVCVWPGSLPHASACSGSSEIAPVPKERFICSGEEGYFADPENCRWFFACLDHGKSPLSAYEFRCPFGLVFDQERLLCEWPWLVPKCGSGGAIGGAVYGDEYQYGQEGRSGGFELDLYDGLGSLKGVRLGGLSGPLENTVAKSYHGFGGANSIGGVGQGSNQIGVGLSLENNGQSLHGSNYALNNQVNGAGVIGENLQLNNINLGGAGHYESGDSGDNGAYIHDNSGEYNHDNSGNYEHVGIDAEAYQHQISTGGQYQHQSEKAVPYVHQSDFGSYNHQGDSGSYQHQGDSGNYQHQGDSGNYEHRGDSGNYQHQGDSGNYQHQGDSASYNGHGDAGSYNHQRDSTNYQQGSSGSYSHQSGSGNYQQISGNAGSLESGSYNQDNSGEYVHEHNAYKHEEGKIEAYNHQVSHSEGYDNSGEYHHESSKYNSGNTFVGIGINGKHGNGKLESGSFIAGSALDASHPTGTSYQSVNSQINHGATFGTGHIGVNNGNYDHSGNYGKSNTYSYSNVQNEAKARNSEKIAIVGGGFSGVGSGIEILQHGINLGNVEHVTPVSVVSSTIPSVTSVPIPSIKSSTSFGVYKGGVVANIPELQYKIENPSTINAHLSSYNGYKNILTGFSSTTPSSLLVAQSPATGYLYPKPEVSFVEGSTAGYDYPKPSVSFEENPVKTVVDYQKTNVGYEYPKPAIKFEENQLLKVKTVPKSSYIQPLKPVGGLKAAVVESYSYQKPSQVIYEGYSYPKPSVSFAEEPLKPAVLSTYTYEKKQPVLSYQEVQHAQPAVTYQHHVQPVIKVDQGYHYEKPAIKFEEKPLVVEHKPVTYQHVNIQKTEGYHYEKPTIAFEEKPVVQYQKPAVITHQVVQPAITYQEVKHEGYHYEKPSVTFEEKPVVIEHKPAVTYQKVNQGYHYEKPAIKFEETPIVHTVEQKIQPAVTYQHIQHHVQPVVKVDQGYHYEKPAIKFEETPVVHTVEQKIQPAVTYQQIQHHVQPVVKVDQGYRYEKPAIKFEEKPVVFEHKPVTYQHVNIQKTEGYHYKKPTIAFEEKPIVYQQPAVTYQETIKPAVTYQEIKHEGYQYEKPAIKFEEKPVVQYQKPVVLEQKVVQPAVTYQQINVHHQKPVLVQQQVQHVQPAVTYTKQEGYHYEKPVVAFEEKPVVHYQKPAIIEQKIVQPAVTYQQVNVHHKQPVAIQHVQPAVTYHEQEGYHYNKPVVAFEEKPIVQYQQPAVVQHKIHHVQPAVTYQEFKPTYKQVLLQPSETPAISIQQPAQQTGYVYEKPTIKFEEKPYQPAPTYLPVEPVKTYIPATKPTLPAPRPTPTYIPIPQPTQTYLPAPQPSPTYLPAPQPTYLPVLKPKKPIQTYIPIQSDVQYHPIQQEKVEINYDYPKVTVPDFGINLGDKQIYEEPIEVKKVQKTYNSGYNYPKPAIKFEEVRIASTPKPSYPSTVASIIAKIEPAPLKEYKYYSYDSRLDQNKQKYVSSTEYYTPSTETYRAPSTQTYYAPSTETYYEEPIIESKPIARYEFSSLDSQYNQFVQQPKAIFVATTPKPAEFHINIPDTGYLPVETPKATYLPVTRKPARRPTSPKTIYLPVKSTTTENYVEISSPSKEYLPVTEIYKVRIPTTTVQPSREYLPVISEKPSREYIPVTRRPSKVYLPVTTAKPSREYLPVTSEKPSREYLPVKTGKQIENYEIDDTYISTRRPKVVKVTKSKTIVKVNDFHPILSAKLGAQCTCVSNTLTLRKKPKQPATYDNLNNDEYVGEKSDIVVEDFQYQPDIAEEYNYEPEKQVISSTRRPTSAIYVEEPVTKAIEVFVKKSRRPAVTIIDDDDKPNHQDIAEAVDTGLKLVKSAVKQGVKEGVREALSTKDFDRYGPGGVRSRTETLQGTVDCQRAGLFRHPTHCNKFYACRWDCTKKKFTLHVFNCPVYLTFDNNLGACNWPSQGPACVDNTLLPSD